MQTTRCTHVQKDSFTSGHVYYRVFVVNCNWISSSSNWSVQDKFIYALLQFILSINHHSGCVNIRLNRIESIRVLARISSWLILNLWSGTSQFYSASGQNRLSCFKCRVRCGNKGVLFRASDRVVRVKSSQLGYRSTINRPSKTSLVRNGQNHSTPSKTKQPNSDQH